MMEVSLNGICSEFIFRNSNELATKKRDTININSEFILSNTAALTSIKNTLTKF